MARLENRRILIEGKPTLVLAGEAHYFRLKRSEWRDRIRKVKECGCNAMATYIPWLIHEEVEGDIDVTGRKQPEHDLGAFIDLCHEAGLWFIARPGPFVMGEMKNEGIPFWVYEKHPDAIPTTWGGVKCTSHNLSYNDPGFLDSVKRWYSAIMPVLAARLDSNGGPVIGVQLDNEIGMLQCWTEEADLSDNLLCDLASFLQHEYTASHLKQRYPFDMGDPFARAKAMRDPVAPWAAAFRQDYNRFLRIWFSRYVATLRTFAEEDGVKGVPFLINIHGSGGGRATTFPIGISQTFEAYTQAEGFLGASDHYLGDLTRSNAPDLFMLNAFMAAVNRPEQPLASMEFEAGSGNYGEDGAVRYGSSASDLKSRISVMQGNRLLNHYLIAGGRNPMLETPRRDGNGRAGTTGERHGFAAPINPEGELDPLYFALQDTNCTLSAVGSKLADMDVEHDNIALGFLPDYYATDVKRPSSMLDVVHKLEAARSRLEALVRAMVEEGFGFTGINLQTDLSREPQVIALAPAVCMDSSVQARLVDFVHQGGRLLIYGRVPTEDLEGRPCLRLADALGIRPGGEIEASGTAFPSLNGAGWAKGEPEVRIWQAQLSDAPQAEVFLSVVGTGEPVGFTVKAGAGVATVLCTEPPMHRSLWRGIWRSLGAKAEYSHDHELGGVYLQRVVGKSGERFLSVVNIDREAKSVKLRRNGRDLVPEPVWIAGQGAKLLPFDVDFGGIRVIAATTEVLGWKPGSLEFRDGPAQETVYFGPNSRLAASAGRIQQTAEGSVLTIPAGSGKVTVHMRP